MKLCVRCSKKAELLCSRCNDSYCTVECQKADWQVHRNICFKMPPLVPDVESLEPKFSSALAMSSKTDKPKTVSPTIPPRTPINFPRNIEILKQPQVTPVKEHSAKNPCGFFDPVLKEINAPRKADVRKDKEVNAPKLRIDSEVMKPVVVPAIPRETMKSVEKGATEKVFAIEAENEKVEETKKNPQEAKENVKESHENMKEIMKTPQDTMKISDEKAKKNIEESSKLQEAEKKPMPEVKKPTQETQKTSGRDDNSAKQQETRNVIQEAKKSPSAQKPINIPPTPKSFNRLMYSDLKKADWPDSKNIKVRLIAQLEKNIFTMTEHSDTVDQYYAFINKSISEYCKAAPKSDYLPMQDEIIFAMFENDWFRARVLDPHHKSSIVQFIDYGNMSGVSQKEMMPNPLDMKYDICARDFIVDNFPDELSEKQAEILSSGTLTITAVRQDNKNFFHCKIFGF